MISMLIIFLAMQNSEQSIGFLISDTARLMRRRFDQRARHLGLTHAQWQVLAHLQPYEGIKQIGPSECPACAAAVPDRAGPSLHCRHARNRGGDLRRGIVRPAGRYPPNPYRD